MASSSGPGRGVGFWQMLRDVLMASMARGQFPLAIVGGIFALLLARMPGEDVSELAFGVMDGLRNGSLAGFALSAMLLLAWVVHARFQRRSADAELRRVTSERNALQEQLLGSRVESSRRRR